jgi:hypothetical protein
MLSRYQNYTILSQVCCGAPIALTAPQSIMRRNEKLWRLIEQIGYLIKDYQTAFEEGT